MLNVVTNASPITTGSGIPGNSRRPAPTTGTVMPTTDTQTMRSVGELSPAFPADLSRIIIVQNATSLDVVLNDPETESPTTIHPTIASSSSPRSRNPTRTPFQDRDWVLATTSISPTTVVRSGHTAPAPRRKASCSLHQRTLTFKFCKGKKSLTLTVNTCKGLCHSSMELQAVPAAQGKPALADFVSRHHCHCCKAAEFVTNYYDFECENGEIEPFNIRQPLSCSCSRCKTWSSGARYAFNIIVISRSLAQKNYGFGEMPLTMLTHSTLRCHAHFHMF